VSYWGFAPTLVMERLTVLNTLQGKVSNEKRKIREFESEDDSVGPHQEVLSHDSREDAQTQQE
jgi:hypothetical protein